QIAADVEVHRQAACDLMTAAELKVLQYLPTHLSFRQIGELTFVTANTVKTQANAIYRKLDVRSRSEAVLRARHLGLIDA
ncbi:MAG TPA: LuxR C-terminal-related transcriptional regulator, partial [Solirubrobacter sp.]